MFQSTRNLILSFLDNIYVSFFFPICSTTLLAGDPLGLIIPYYKSIGSSVPKKCLTSSQKKKKVGREGIVNQFISLTHVNIKHEKISMKNILGV